MVPLEFFFSGEGPMMIYNILAYARLPAQGKCLHLPFSMSTSWEIFTSIETTWKKPAHIRSIRSMISRSSCAAQCQTCFWHPPAKGKRDPSNILSRQCPLKHCAGFSGVLNLLVDTSNSQKLARTHTHTHVLCDALQYIMLHLTLKVLNGGVIFQHQLHVKPH